MFSTLYYTFSKCNLHGYSSFSMLFHCWKSALKEEKKVRRVFYPKITQRSCYAKHFTCTQNLARHSMFKTNEFQACYQRFFQAVGKFILYGKSAYSVRLNCIECTLKDGCFIRRLSSDPAMYSTVPTPKKQPYTVYSI